MSNWNGARRIDAIAFGLRLISTALFFMASTSDVLAACSVKGRFRLTSEGPWTRFMSLTSGSGCGNTFRSFGAMHYKRLYLVTRPQHGKVVLREGGHYRFFSEAGYHGSDSFTLRICGNTNGHDGCANLQYNVTVE